MEQKIIFNSCRAQLGRCRFVTAAIIAVVLATGSEARAQTATTKEYKVKATYLFNFAQFVEWPAAVFGDATAPIVIGVLGDDEFGPFLDQLVQGEKVKGRLLIVKRSRKIDELQGCHILFISKSEEARLTAILALLESSSILTVGEIEGFAQRGGIINFFLEGEKLRFEINPEAADRCGLKIRAQLLSLSKIVTTVKSKEHK